MKVMVVDDERELGSLVAAYLKRRGHECLAVGNLEEARQGFEEFGPEAVVLDQYMPDGNGLSLIPDFKSKGPVWVVMVTGAGNLDAEDQAREAGADCFLAKPVDLKSLSRCLEERCPPPAAPAPGV